MKRLLVLILVLALLWGCGAGVAEPSDGTVGDSEPPAPTGSSGFEDLELEPLSLVIDDGQVEDPTDWVWFYWASQAGRHYIDPLSSTDEIFIEITKRYPADELEPAREFHSTLTWDGEVFTLTEEEGSFTYKYLLYSANEMPPQSHYDFAEYYLLSDDPEMTAETYFNALLSSTLPVDLAPTRIVYSDYHDFDRAEAYGSVPAEMTPWLDVSCWAKQDWPVSNFFYRSHELPDTWDEGVLLPTAADRLPEDVSARALLETADGGYVLFRAHLLGRWLLQNPVISYIPSYCEIIATGYAADGTPLWQTATPIFVT